MAFSHKHIHHNNKIMCKKIIPWFLTLILITGCNFGADFSSNDPNIELLIESINRYQEDTGFAPNNLDDLIPIYLDKIPYPKSVSKIDYSPSESRNSWKLTYYVKTDSICEYKSQSNNWGCTLLPPD